MLLVAVVPLLEQALNWMRRERRMIGEGFSFEYGTYNDVLFRGYLSSGLDRNYNYLIVGFFLKKKIRELVIGFIGGG